MKRPRVIDHFDKDEFGHINSMDVDFPSYQSALNEYIDHLEGDLKESFISFGKFAKNYRSGRDVSKAYEKWIN